MASDNLKKWFDRNDGKGWIDCKTGKPCGRKSRTKSKRPYPACRPTKAQCNDAKDKKKGPDRISWKKPKRKKMYAGGTVRGQGIVMTNRLRQNNIMSKLKNPKKADLNKDGKINSYEEKRAKAIEKAMAAQNRVKKKNGGFTAKGCGSVMDQKRKVTTISQEYKMYKKTKGYAIGGKRKGMKKGGGLMKTKGYATGGVVKPKGKAGGGAMNTKGYKRGGKV